MSRPRRHSPGGMVFHVLNRGVGRRVPFIRGRKRGRESFKKTTPVLFSALTSSATATGVFCSITARTPSTPLGPGEDQGWLPGTRRAGPLLGKSLALTAVSSDDTIENRMSQKHQRTLEAIFDEPVRSNIPWRDIEGMLKAAGAEITEGEGSRVRIALNGVRAVFHRPHPQKETDKGAVRSMRRFLTEAGVTP